MSILSVRDNEKRKWKKTRDTIEQGGTEAIAKGWVLNDFIVHLS